MRICLLEPYDTGSHRAWVRGYRAHSQHSVQALALKGAFWKWRMHGGAVTLARCYRESRVHADLLLATDMLDLTTFLSLTRDLTATIPVALYMHENQLTYPPRPGEKRDLHYGFINYASMLCADRILFNSRFHLESWFDELPRLLKHFPDYNELDTVSSLRERSTVLPLGLDLRRLDVHRAPRADHDPPLIIWNHRWEYDKNPELFFYALYKLAERGAPFQVAVLGEQFVRVPPAFEEARARLGARVAHFGYADSPSAYAEWLWRGDIVVSTAIHDFFGSAVVEAMYSNCQPVLPNRLSYPQFIPHQHVDSCLYSDDGELVEMLCKALDQVSRGDRLSLREAAAPYDWSQVAPLYDSELECLVNNRTE